ncbi:sensor histidine kinase [Paenibacillus sp. GCM10027626]|uniref:sensor histidine kinase n=1 Tax=Paenibacillus sp. GCM10027626 TaxID=3273411 RepID=UPI00362E95CD
MGVKQGQQRERPPIIFAVIWLLYLIFPISSILEQPIAGMVLDFFILVLFVAAYIVSFASRKFRFVLILVQLVLVSFFSVRYHGNFLYMAFYPSPVIGTLPSVRKMALALGAMLLLFVSVILYNQIYLDQAQLLQLLPALLVMLAMPLAMRAGIRSKELRAKLTLANEEIARLSKVEERQRISRDLHDTLGHTLSLITLKSELTERLIPLNPERAVKEVRDVQTASRAALSQVRELVSGMNLVTIQEEVIQAKKILSAAGIVLELKGPLETAAPSPVIDNIVGMCLREAVTNVVKHSRATTCIVERADSPGELKLIVEDNGIGTSEDTGNGTGLAGISKRLKLVEGSMRYESQEAGGTRLVFTVPRIAKGIVTDEGR